ncbi:DUF6538 domain-containing protein [Ferrimonas sediminum]|uniref:DUF6538 domain-containing protein n=1 Tax=Ferrimonas sediminum TaxID=718193 RepID=UPI003CCBF730
MRISNTLKSQSVPYLFQSRHGIWYARVVVPKSLHSQVGHRDLKQSLRTRCRREAIQRSWQFLDNLALKARAKEQTVDQQRSSSPQSRSQAPVEPPRIEPVKQPQDDSPKLSEVVKLFTAEKLKVNAWKPHEVAHNEFAYRE